MDYGVLLISFFILALCLLLTVFYLLALQRAFETISTENRKLTPGMVWLCLVPLFNFYWMFVVTRKLAASFRDEFISLGIPSNEANPTEGIGNTKNVLRLLSHIPVLGIIAFVAFIGCWLAYWTQVLQATKKIIDNRGNTLLDAEQGIFHH